MTARRHVAALVALGALALPAAACGSSSPLASACKGYSDVLVTARTDPAHDGGTQLVLLHPDGTVARQVTGHDLVATNPSFSPDGHKVVFEEQVGTFGGAGPTASALAIIGAGGSGLQRITGGAQWSDQPADHHGGPYDLRPDWAPAGDSILYSHRDGDVQELYTVTPGGAPKRLLAAPAGARDVVGAWSPDGHHVAFVRDVGTPGHPAQQLWTADADGANPVQQAQFVDPVDTSLMEVTWSPDSQKVSLSHPGPGDNVQPLRVLDLATHAITASTITSDLAWTADGDRLYARSYTSTGWQLTLLRLSGGAIADVNRVGAPMRYIGAAGLDVASC